MNRESTLNSGELMDTSNQLNSALCFSTSPDVSFGNTLNSTKEPIGVNWTSNLLEGTLFIVSNGTYQNESIPSYWQHSVDLLTYTFNGVISLNDYPQNFFQALTNAYADLYNIELHLIVYNNNKYTIINKSKLSELYGEPYKREKHAFIWCNANNTAYSPLYINDVNGHKITVFKTDEMIAWHCAESFVNHVNQELLNIKQNPIELHLNPTEYDLSNMAIDENFPSTNYLVSAIIQPDTTVKGDIFVEEILQQIHQLVHNLKPRLNQIPLGNQVPDFNMKNLDQISPQGLTDMTQQRLMLISEVIQMLVEQIPQNNDNTISTDIVFEENSQQQNTIQWNETNHVVQTDQNLTNVKPTEPLHLLNVTQIPENPSITTLTQLQYDAPEILIQPKNEWHYRNMKDLGKKRNPLLAGDGPQRTAIRVKVPPRGDHPMYLGVKIQTYDGREHRSKIPVPEHTTVNMESFSNDNNLDRLQFNQCNQTDYFDSMNKYVYLAISPTEHQTQEKDVRIHMFNLYQSGSITKDLINTEQLGKCKLVFWLCTLEDGVYTPISTSSSSCLIEENKLLF